MRKKALITFMIAVLAAAMLAGCGNQSSNSRNDASGEVQEEDDANGEVKAEKDDASKEMMSESNDTEMEYSEQTNEKIVVELDVSELDARVEKYRSINYQSCQYLFTNITSNDWQNPDIVLVCYRPNDIMISVGHYDSSIEYFNSYELRNNIFRDRERNIVYTDRYEVFYGDGDQAGEKQLCFHLWSDECSLGRLEYWHFGSLPYYSDKIDINKNYLNKDYLSCTADINWNMMTGCLYYHNPYVEDWANDEGNYQRAVSVQRSLYNYNSYFSDADMYSSLDEAYEAYLNSLPSRLGYSDDEIQFVHAEDLLARAIEEIGSPVFDLYKDYFDSNNISCLGCEFINLDGDGTPELIAWTQNNEQTGEGTWLYYIDADGNVVEMNTGSNSGYIEGTGEFWIQDCTDEYNTETGEWISESFNDDYYVLRDGKVIYEGGIFEYLIKVDNGSVKTYFYSNADRTVEEITEEQYNAYLDNEREEYPLMSYGEYEYDSLEEAWLAYNN